MPEFNTRKSTLTRRKLLIQIMVALGGTNALLAGCGGGGGGGSAIRVTPLKVTIAWPTRTRNISAPSSALSCRITLTKAGANGADFVFTVDRGTALEAFTQTYTSTDSVLTGSTNALVEFYSEVGASGTVVAHATALVSIKSDGTGLNSLTVGSTVKSVVILPNQSIHVGSSSALTASALDEQGSLVALTPGSFSWTLLTGNSTLILSPDGTATGLTEGAAEVQVRANNITSARVIVSIVRALTNTQTKTIGAGASGTLALLSGSGIAIPTSTLPADTTLTLTDTETFAGQFPNTDVVPVGPVLTLSLASTAQTGTLHGDIPVTLVVPAAQLASLAQAIPTFAISGNGQTLYFALDGDLNTTTGAASIILPADVLGILESQGLGYHGLKVQITYAVLSQSTQAASRSRAEPTVWANQGYGLYVFDGNAWQKATPSSLQKNVPTTIYVHGVYSNPGDAFGNKDNVNRLSTLMGSSQSVAYFYDWTRPVKENGKALADAITDQGLTNINFVEHSMGGIVTGNALGNLPSSVNVSKEAIFGSPLDGTAVASQGRYMATLFINAAGGGSQYGLAANTLLDFTIPSLRDMTPGSDAVNAANEARIKRKGSLEIFVAAGTGSLLTGDRLVALLSGIDPAGFDGIIPKDSALAKNLREAGMSITTAISSGNHIELTRDSSLGEAMFQMSKKTHWTLHYKGDVIRENGTLDQHNTGFSVTIRSDGSVSSDAGFVGNFLTACTITEVGYDLHSGEMLFIGYAGRVGGTAHLPFTWHGTDSVTGDLSEFLSGGGVGYYSVRFKRQ